MLNEDVRVAPIDDDEALATWENPAAFGASWVFANGEWEAGPIVPGLVEFAPQREVDVRFDVNASVALEIHDKPDNLQVVQAVEAKPNVRPVLIWNGVPEAVLYRIFHRAFGGVAERLIYEDAGAPDVVIQKIDCPERLDGVGGRWHFLRVEAVDEFGNESQRESWAFFVMEPPAVPEIEIEAGSGPGLYTLIIEE